MQKNTFKYLDSLGFGFEIRLDLRIIGVILFLRDKGECSNFGLGTPVGMSAGLAPFAISASADSWLVYRRTYNICE